MRKLLILLAAAVFAADPPRIDLTNGHIKLFAYLPDPANGFYRGTRFDWSGMIGNLEYRGHRFYGPWFQRTGAGIHDFIYEGDRIAAGPNTAAIGPVEEFLTGNEALGFGEAKPGGTFIKIGVGVLRRPDARPYDRFHLYDIVDPGKWKSKKGPDSIAFSQELSDPATGYGYEYRKMLRLAKGAPHLVLEHSIKNTGKRPIASQVYDHNFMNLDGEAPGPDLEITVPFEIHSTQPPDPALAEIHGKRIVYRKKLEGEERVMTSIGGFGKSSSDYDIRIENRKSGAGVQITSDRPLSNLMLWSIRAVMSVEPYIAFTIQPGETFTWKIDYRYQ